MNKKIKYFKLISIIIVVLGLGYSIYLNLKLNDYMRIQEFIQLRFPDKTLPLLRGYDNFDKKFKKAVSFYDITICNLKDDLKKLNINYSQATSEILYLEKSKKNMLDNLNFKRDSLSEYLEGNEHVDCNDIDMKIQKNTKE